MTTTAEAGRDKGFMRVTNANKAWMRSALLRCMQWRLNALADGSPNAFIAEDIRRALSTEIGEPTHHNAWGALTRLLLNKKIIRPNGTMRPMRTPRSHARQSPGYWWTPL